MTPSRTRTLTGLLLALALAGCVSSRASRQADIASQLGNWDEAVVRYMEAVEQDPGNIEYRGALLRAKIAASQAHFEKAKRYQQAKVWDRAMIELQQAVELDPTNQYAEAELANVRAQIESAGAATTTIDDLKKKASGARPQPPTLNPRSNKPISLNFPEPVSIFQIYRALGKAFGINILFDPNLKDQEITIELEDVTAQSALETLMRAAGQFYKVLDEHTIIIAADTPQNRRLYEDLVIQTFFLSNAEVKDMMTILRSLVDAKKIATNDQLNAIILRDTADKVKVAERIIESNDKAKAEVVVDVELMQLDTSKIRDLGMALSQYSVTPVARHRRHRRPAAGLRSPVPQPEQLDADHPQLRLQLRQVEHRRPAPRPAAAPHQRGGEGAAGDRRPGADPGDDLQHLQHRRQQHRPHHLLPVPGRRHHHRDRAARPPQQGGHPQGQGRGEQHQRLHRGLRRPAAAAHRHPHHRLDDPPQRRRDQLPRRPHPHRRKQQRPRGSPGCRRSPSSATCSPTSTPTAAAPTSS